MTKHLIWSNDSFYLPTIQLDSSNDSFIYPQYNGVVQMIPLFTHYTTG